MQSYLTRIRHRMPARPRGRGFRGGRGNYGNHWMGHRGGTSRGGGRGMGHRGGRIDHYRGKREMHNPHHRPHNPEKLLSSLGPEAQLALTTAIINTVLKNDGREGRGGYRGRDYHPRHSGSHREGRGEYFQEESRDRRHFGEDRRSHEPRPYHEEGRGHHYEREKSTSGSPRYRNNRYSAMPRRRPSPHGHPGPSRKRQRMERMDSMESDSSVDHSHNYEEEKHAELERERFHSLGPEREHKAQESKENKDDEDKEEGSNGPGGVQVTIGADGERAVNNEGRGHPRVGGRLFVELRCPHCPSQRSITFKEYKYHLGSEGHKIQLSRLARKHSVVLRKIRVQQRQEQREIEMKWKEEQSEEFKNSVTRFCNTCKLAFKCLGGNTGEGIDLHNNSKLHRMQKCYLHPRCSMCHATFPSRMVYEYHIASISHLRVRTATMERTGGHDPTDEQDQEEEEDELDLANFLTLDSVGEDDDVGSEHEEITGGLDEEEAAKEAEGNKGQSSGSRFRRGMIDDDELSTEADWDKEQLDDEEVEENEAVGTEYVNRIEVYFCSLCSKVIRADTSLGSRAVQRHCRSFDHLANYRDAHPAEDQILSGEETDDEIGTKVEKQECKHGERDEAEPEMEEDPEQENFWEEVNKSLDMLQGAIMTEIEDSCNSVNEDTTTEGKKKAEAAVENVRESNNKLKEVGEDFEEETSFLEKGDVSRQERHHELPADFLEDIAEDSEEDT